MQGVAPPQNKHDRRAAMLSPHSVEHEASVERAMSKGIQPKGLDALVTWFRVLIHEEVPVTLHKAERWHDHGMEAEGGSRLGAPGWTDPFRRFIESVEHQSMTDAEGFYRWPVRATLSRMSRRKPLTARALYQLALMDGDWRRLADQMSYPDEFMELYIERALAMCWREFSNVRLMT